MAIGQPRPLTAIEPSIVRASDCIMDLISAAVPRHLPQDLRDDVVQNIWMAVLEGRLKQSEIAFRALEFIYAEYKDSHNAWGTRSLDARLSIESDATLLDRLSTEDGTGYWDVNMMASAGGGFTFGGRLSRVSGLSAPIECPFTFVGDQGSLIPHLDEAHSNQGLKIVGTHGRQFRPLGFDVAQHPAKMDRPIWT